MSKPQHLFVVDEDAALRALLTEFLERHGHTVTALGNAEALLDLGRHPRPDLVVLDAGLPGVSGLEACKRLRERGDAVPVILLGAPAHEADRVIGLELGADDYLAKPFGARELLARVRAVLRRARPTPALPEGLPPGLRPVRLGEQVFDPQARSLRRGAEVRPLSTLEFALLVAFTARPGVPLTRERLVEATHFGEVPPLPRTIDTAVMRLRRLIEPDPATPRYIQTVRGRGYVYVPAAV